MVYGGSDAGATACYRQPPGSDPVPRPSQSSLVKKGQATPAMGSPGAFASSTRTSRRSADRRHVVRCL